MQDLAQYTSVLESNGIYTVESVALFTEDDIIKMGVSVGVAKMMIKKAGGEKTSKDVKDTSSKTSDETILLISKE